MNNVMITGGAGFIGFNFVKLALKKTKWKLFVVDSLTYAAYEGAVDFFKENESRIVFIKEDIAKVNEEIVTNNNIDTIINFAAETHVDNSIANPLVFVKTNVNGTANLLELTRKLNLRFHQISTDEVYGDLPLHNPEIKFTVNSKINPSSPYSASKAAADLLVQAYVRTYRIRATISRCSNNYGPYQDKEKLIPKTILSLLKGEKIGIYGDGKNVRDWIFVEDHNLAVLQILKKVETGIYNIGSTNEINNLKIVATICEHLELDENKVIQFIEDRKGHDRRYAIDPSSMQKLEWKAIHQFDKAIVKTINYYKKL